MLTVHHLENSRSQRVLWMLEELGLTYEVKRYPRDPKTMLAPHEMRAIHPLGKSPILVDGDRVLAESGAVLEYLVEREGGSKLAPPAGAPERLPYRFFMHYAEGSVMSPLLMKLIFSRVRSAPAPFFVRPIKNKIADTVTARFITPQLDLHFDFIEKTLERTEWFAGASFSAADIQMSYPLEAASARAGESAKRPKIEAFLSRIHARPAYMNALERGGPYDLMR